MGQSFIWLYHIIMSMYEMTNDMRPPWSQFNILLLSNIITFLPIMGYPEITLVQFWEFEDVESLEYNRH